VGARRATTREPTFETGLWPLGHGPQGHRPQLGLQTADYKHAGGDPGFVRRISNGGNLVLQVPGDAREGSRNVEYQIPTLQGSTVCGRA
jgi:hypothetical protein